MTREQRRRDERLGMLRTLKSPTQDQRTLLALVKRAESGKNSLGATEKRQLEALWTLDRAATQAQAARASLMELAQEDRAEKRRKRDHQIYRCGALVGAAGIVDFDTGEFRLNGFDNATLLGALLGLARVSDAERLAGWKQAGAAKLDEIERAKMAPKSKEPMPGPMVPEPDWLDAEKLS